MRLKEIDFSSLEIREIGAWPLILRVGVLIGAAIATLLLVYFLIFMPELTSLEDSVKKLDDKRKEFKDQYTLAVNFDAYQAQMNEMQNAYQEYIKQLPSSSNIPELIDSITKIGERNGLKINSIKLGDPKLISGFYMSMPLTLSVVGGFHNIGLFINETAKLARIVTLHDFTLKESSDAANVGQLQMDMQAQTYWLASQAEIDTQKTDVVPGKKGRGKTPAKGAAPAGPSGADAGPTPPSRAGPPGPPAAGARTVPMPAAEK